MAVNIFVKLPKRGDIVVGDTGAKKVRYIAEDTFDKTDLTTHYSSFEIIGVVYRVRGKKVDILYKSNSAQKFCSRIQWTMKSIAGKSITFSITTAGINWDSTNLTTLTVDLSNITDSSTIVSTLNTAFSNNTDFVSQDWRAVLQEDGTIVVTATWSVYRQYSYNKCVQTGTTTSLWTNTSMSEVPTHASIRRKNGNRAGKGVISCWAIARYYYKNNTGASDHMGNTNTEITPDTLINRDYPINITTYNGSNYSGVDYCSSLRTHFGTGEEGWEKCNKTLLPVRPNGSGDLREDIDGLEITKKLYNYTYIDSSGNTVCGCPAAKYAYEVSTTCIPQGNWHLPTVAELSYILLDLEYPIDAKGNTTTRETGDIINKSLYKISGSAVSNSSGGWSCLRSVTFTSWSSFGGYGFFDYYNVTDQNLAVSVCSIELSD